MPHGAIATRRTELLAALSIAIDLGLGQPTEHVLRSSIIAARLAARLNLGREDRLDVEGLRRLARSISRYTDHGSTATAAS